MDFTEESQAVVRNVQDPPPPTFHFHVMGIHADEAYLSLQAIRMSIADQLPEEPSNDCTEPVTMIRVRGPGGTVLTRRFLAQNPLQVSRPCKLKRTSTCDTNVTDKL